MIRTDLVFLPRVASIAVPESLELETMRLTGAPSGPTIAITLLLFTIFPKPTWIKSLKILYLLPYLFYACLKFDALFGNLHVVRL